MLVFLTPWHRAHMFALDHSVMVLIGSLWLVFFLAAPSLHWYHTSLPYALRFSSLSQVDLVMVILDLAIVLVSLSIMIMILVVVLFHDFEPLSIKDGLSLILSYFPCMITSSLLEMA